MLMSNRRPKQSRMRRYARRALYGVGIAVGAVLLLLVLGLFSLRFAKVRGYVVGRANGALAGSFKGRIALHHLQYVGLSGVRGVEAEIFDPSGHRVIDLHGAEVRLGVLRVAWSALTHGQKPLKITIDRVAASHVEASLIDDGAGSPTLADAFQPKTPSPPSSGPGTIIAINRLELGHVWAHGALAGTPPLDVELRNARGSLQSRPDTTNIAFEKVSVAARGLPQGVDPSGELKASLSIPAAPNAPLSAKAHYEGKAADIPLVLDASYIASKLVAQLDAKEVPPAAVAKLAPGVELRSPASLTAHAEGTMPEISGTFALAEEESTLDGDFALSLKDDLRAKAKLQAREIDAAAFSRAAPRSKLDLTLHSAVLVPKRGPMTGSFELASEPAVVSGQAVPAIAVNGKFLNDAQSAQAKAEAHVEIGEPGAHTSIDATLARGARTNVEFRSTTSLDNPRRLQQLARARLSGDLRIQGNYEVEAQRLEAEANANLREVSQGENHVSRVTLRASANGTLPHPNTDIWLDLKDANLAGQHLADAKVALRGSLSRAALSAEVAMLVPRRHIQISSIVSNDNGILLDHPSVNLSQADTNLRLSAKTVQVVHGRTTIANLHLEGAGTADASLVLGHELESASVQTSQLDLARLWRLVDRRAPLKAGTATISLKYEKNGRNPQAELKLRADNLTLDRIRNGALEADFMFKDRRLDGKAEADLKQAGHLSASLSELRGIDLEQPKPERLSGKLELEGQLDLRDLDQLVPAGSHLPIARARGQVKYDLTVERDQPGPGLPLVHVHVTSKNLQLAGARDSKINLTTRQQALAAAPPSIKGLDFNLDFKHEEAGETEIDASMSDEHGALGSISIEAKVAPRLANAARELEQNWQTIPLKVHASMPRRDIEKLPVEVRPAGLSGVASGELSYEGVITQPDLKFSGKVEHFRQSEARTRGLDLAWEGGYSGARATFKGTAKSGARQVGSADLSLETAIGDWLHHRGGPLPKMSGNALVQFDGFPIELFPGTQTSQVGGALSGKIELKDFGKDASLVSQLEAKPFKVGETEFARISSEINAQGKQAKVALRVEARQGLTTVDAHSGFSWGAKLAPSLALPADAELRAQGFRLAAVAPFVASSFGELDGRVNGELHAHFRGGAPALDGHIDIDRGVAQVASLGQRFEQIQGRISVVPGQVKLEKLSARATSGKLNVTGEANLNGLDLTNAVARVRIAKPEAISVSVAGTEIGDAWGAIDVNMKPGNAETSSKLAVNIPELHVRVADTGGQDVQALDPAKDVRIGTGERYGDFVTLPLQPLTDSEPAKNERPMIVEITLGKQIWIQRGDSTKVQLSGKTEMTLGDPTRMTGQINLRGGKLDVQGKQFEIESGTVTFAGDPGNPTIVATARWDAPDDEQHRVYADYSGTVKNGKVTLRSEPPLTEDQVLSLLLLGTPDGTIGGPSTGGSTAATAVGAVGGAATQGLNKALSNLSSLDVSTRIDSSTGSARPELVVQLTPKVSANITRALGAPAPGQPPDMTFLTFDFRIHSRWSLSALVGDRGESGLDLIWRRRY
ncbi:MAG TPA: translocation/assembly module TamB domain-containing protein [Polyangiaceae bacterium]|jgi:translocation and assembly module TamB